LWERNIYLFLNNKGIRNIALPHILSALNYKYFFTLIKRNRVSIIDTGIIYALEYKIVLFGPIGSIVYLINIVKKRKKVEFLLDCLGTYNCKSFI